MKYIEIDGDRIAVHECRDCPCMEWDDWHWYCKHPKRTKATHVGLDRYERYSVDMETIKCPLREVEE